MDLPQTRRSFLIGAAGALGALTLPSVAVDGARSKKKGWGGNSPNLHEKFRVSWYYDWTGNGRSSESVEYVPMIWGAKTLGQQPLQKSTGPKPPTALLGFNEPERGDQSKMSLDQAIELWPKLEELATAHKLRLGSPAPSSDPGGMRWLEAFMERADRQKLRVDFVALHWYRSRDGSAFATWLNEMHRKYRRPLWITEFNGWSGTERENLAFVRTALRALERDSDVERYAYFNTKAGHPCALLGADGAPTKLGELYLEA